MATAKLWWNGSAWTTSSTKWKSEEKMGNNSMGVRHYITIAAYDDNTIKMAQSFAAYTTNLTYFSINLSSTAVTVKSGSTTIGTGAFSGKNITSYTKFSYSGTASSYGTANYSNYGSGDISFSGSTTISSPFRTITFNTNGGTGNVGTQTVLYNTTAKVTPKATPTRTNYTFIGWNTKADGSGTKYSTGSNIKITSNTTLYAQWTQSAFLVTINAGEGATITFDGDEFSGESTTLYKASGTYAVTIAADAGYVLKTRSPAADGNVNISDNTTVLSATAQHVGCRIDDGDNWVQALIYVDDGNDWVMCQAYVDDGNDWILLN